MSQYDAIYPTIRGRAMLTQALREQKALIFTRAEWGDGVKKENQPSDLFEGLIHKVIESGFTKKEQDGNVLFLTTVYDNSKLNEGFYVREIGVYAKVGDDGQEYLYAYTYANIASYTPPSKQYNEKRLKIGLAVDKAAKIEIKFNSQQYATREELDLHNADAAAHAAAFLIHNKDTNAHKVLFDKFVKDVKIKSNAENSFIVTKGDNSTTTVTINNVEHADEATKANFLATNENGAIYHDLSKVKAGADVSLRVNWSAKDNTRKIMRYIFHDAKGTGDLADIQAKTVYADLNGNSSSSNKLISERASSRPTSANIPTSADASIRYFLSTSSMQYSKPMTNGAIVQFGWYGSDNYDSQLFIPNNTEGCLQWRPQNGSSTWATSAQWKSLAWQDDLNNYLPLTGGTITGGMTFNGNVNAKNGIIVPTRSRGDNTTYAASTEFVQDAISALSNGSPAALDTLKELAEALGNDANFASTITKQLGLKAPLASPSFTGTVTGPTPALEANNTQFATTAWVLQSIAAHATGPIVGDISSANAWWVKIPCVGFNLLIQGGRDMTESDVAGDATVSFPVAFKQCFNVEIAILGNFNESMVLSDFNNLYFKRFSHQNFVTDAHVVRPCTWTAYGISQ